MTHPPALLTLTARTLREARLFARGDGVLVAVSGGPDSMALLHVLARLRDEVGHTLVAHGVDHGLREAAVRELDIAADFARSLDVPFARTTVTLARGGNLQARARTVRYEALRVAAAASNASVIATAHHRDDRAETVLLRLLRGSGPGGLAVLPPRQAAPQAPASGFVPELVRPFIHASRAAIDAHVSRHAIPFSADPSNLDPRFLRTRVRHELLPLLRALSPAIDDHLCALADQLGQLAVAPPVSEKEAHAADPSLPRASRHALELLARNRSPRARVALKNGLVARWDPLSGRVAVEAAATRKRK